MEKEILDLLRAELKKQLAEVMDPAWQVRVTSLAKRLPREYQLVQHFARCLAYSLEEVKAFPERFEKWTDRPLAHVAAPSVTRTEEEEQDEPMPREELAQKTSAFIASFFGRTSSSQSASDAGGVA